MAPSSRQIIAIGLLACGAVLLINRRIGRSWGATATEVASTLPGDDLIAHPLWQTTHAITIRTCSSEIWPWLVQMGITRGGWYLSERLDRIVWRIDNPSADRIVPELQQLAVGDVVPDSVDGTAYFRVASMEPQASLVLHSKRHPTSGVWPDVSAPDPGLYLNFSWAFVLREVDRGTTRLLLRTRATVMHGHLPAAGWVRMFLPLVDFADFIYTRQMLRGIRGRVERTHRARGCVVASPVMSLDNLRPQESTRV